MLNDILQRIEQRLEALNITANLASQRAGLSKDAIRNLRRAARDGTADRKGISTATAEGLARSLETSVSWLLDGIGDANEASSPSSYTVPVMGYVGAGATVDPEAEQVPPEGLDTIEVPFPLPPGVIALVVRGDSMLPRYDEGDAIIVYREQKRSLTSFYGEEAAVRTSSGMRYLKIIHRGEGDTVTLNSFNAKPIENVQLDWIGEIYITIRSGQISRMKIKELSASRKSSAPA